MSDTATETAAEPVDYTVDPTALAFGQIVYRHGYQPAIFLGLNTDGTLEVSLLPDGMDEPAGDFSTVRGPKPNIWGPLAAAVQSSDARVAALESQLASMQTLLAAMAAKAGVVVNEPAAPAAPEPAPAPDASPVTPFTAPAPAPAAPEPAPGEPAPGEQPPA